MLQDPITPSSQNSLNAMTGLADSRENRAAQLEQTKMSLAAQMERERMQQQAFDKQRVFQMVEAEKARNFTAEQTKAAIESNRDDATTKFERDKELITLNTRLTHAFNADRINMAKTRIANAAGDAFQPQLDVAEQEQLIAAQAAEAAAAAYEAGGQNLLGTIEGIRTGVLSVLNDSQALANRKSRDAFARVSESVLGKAIPEELKYGEWEAIAKLFDPRDDFKALTGAVADRNLGEKVLREAITPGSRLAVAANANRFVELADALTTMKGAIENGTVDEPNAQGLKERVSGLVQSLKDGGVSMEEIVGTLHGAETAFQQMSDLYQAAVPKGKKNPAAANASALFNAQISKYTNLYNALAYDPSVVRGEVIPGFNSISSADFEQSFNRHLADGLQAISLLDPKIERLYDQFIENDNEIDPVEQRVIDLVDPVLEGIQREQNGVIEALTNRFPLIGEVLTQEVGEKEFYTYADLGRIQNMLDGEARGAAKKVQKVLQETGEAAMDELENFLDESLGDVLEDVEGEG